MNLTEFFRNIGLLIVEELRNHIFSQVDIDGRAFMPVREQINLNAQRLGTHTIHKVKHLSPHGSSQISEHKRLYNTGQFAENVYQSESGIDFVDIKTNPGIYPGSNISYADILEYNDRNSEVLSGKRATLIRSNGPNLFPRDQSELFKLQTMQNFESQLIEEVSNQLNKDNELHINETIII